MGFGWALVKDLNPFKLDAQIHGWGDMQIEDNITITKASLKYLSNYYRALS